MMHWRIFGSGLARTLAAGLALGWLGCAGKTTTVVLPPPTPAPRQIPIRVSTAPVKPETKPESSTKAGAAEAPWERGGPAIEGYAAAIKKIPSYRRTRPKGEKEYPIDLNLKNADLVEAVRVLMETMSLNYMIDPRVKGTVNVRATGKLSQSELLGILEAFLVVNNATLIKGDKVYKIVPLEKASTGAMPVYSKGVTPVGMTAQVIFLQQTDPKELVKVLKPMVSAGGAISEGSHNSLILVDYPGNLEKLLELIHLVDSRALSQTLVRLLRVQNSDPNEIIGEMETIFSAYGALAQKGKFGVSFMPVPRLNSVMVLAASPVLMDRAVYWVRQLDLQSEMLANVHVYHVQNYKAKNLADLLTQAYGGQVAAAIKEKKPETGAAPTFGRAGTGATGGLGTTGGLGAGTSGMGATTGTTGLGAGTSGLGTTGAAGTTAGTGAAAAAPATGKERATAAAGLAGAGAAKEGVRIIPDEENNLLVVVAPPHEWRIISELLPKLDIMPRQILAEVLIAEITLTDELRYGIEWFLGATPTTGTTSSGTVTTGTAAALSNVLNPTTSGTTTLTGSGGQSINLTSTAASTFSQAGGFAFAVAALNTVKTLVNVLATEGKVKVLASPTIMAANNQEARIHIGADTPVLTSESVPLVSQTTSFSTSTVQYRSTGIILSVKPQINKSGLVTLDISQEVSSVQPTTSGVNNTPTFTIRTAKTSLITGDNQTVVLGGLIRDDMSRTKSGIPILRKMPILGGLFGLEDTSYTKTELIVLITPHIITNLEEGAKITQEMKDKVLQAPLPQAPRPTGAPPAAAAPEPARSGGGAY
jgi:general secretion pathway protein D